MEAPELKPCPFCGGDAAAVYNMFNDPEKSWTTQWTVDCDLCPATVGPLESEAEAITAWNTRAPDPDLDAHIGAALAEAAEACGEQKAAFLDPAYASPQPMGSFSERFACDECASAILALRPTALTALDRAKRKARVEGMRAAFDAAEAQQTERCAKCGAPRNDHHYRHPFVSSGFSDPLAAIRALIEKEGKP